MIINLNFSTRPSWCGARWTRRWRRPTGKATLTKRYNEENWAKSILHNDTTSAIPGCDHEVLHDRRHHRHLPGYQLLHRRPAWCLPPGDGGEVYVNFYGVLCTKFWIDSLESMTLFLYRTVTSQWTCISKPVSGSPTTSRRLSTSCSILAMQRDKCNWWRINSR